MNALSTPIADVPGVGRPAVRALAAQDLHLVGDLAGRHWPELARLHGVGPAAGRRLQAALAEHGATMQDPPAPERRRDVVTRGATGTGASDLRTHVTEVDPAEYVAGLEPRRRRDGARLLAGQREPSVTSATLNLPMGEGSQPCTWLDTP